MNIREEREAWERAYLSPYASRSSETRGRDREEQKCDIRPEYQRDRDRILHSKAFRRMKHKTQVFLAPRGDHYRTRLTHTLEVSQTARTIARALRLNEDLTEAIALGHDLGHAPFGHAGEAVLNAVNAVACCDEVPLLPLKVGVVHQLDLRAIVNVIVSDLNDLAVGGADGIELTLGKYGLCNLLRCHICSSYRYIMYIMRQILFVVSLMPRGQTPLFACLRILL